MPAMRLLSLVQGQSKTDGLTRAEFEQVVDTTLEALPTWVTSEIDNLHVEVQEVPTPEQGDVLGLYEGVSLPDRSADYWGVLPDRIIVFRQPHLEMGLDRPELEAEIRKTVLHEVAHHLGIDDARLDELGWS